MPLNSLMQWMMSSATLMVLSGAVNLNSRYDASWRNYTEWYMRVISFVCSPYLNLTTTLHGSCKYRCPSLSEERQRLVVRPAHLATALWLCKICWAQAPVEEYRWIFCKIGFGRDIDRITAPYCRGQCLQEPLDAGSSICKGSAASQAGSDREGAWRYTDAHFRGFVLRRTPHWCALPCRQLECNPIHCDSFSWLEFLCIFHFLEVTTLRRWRCDGRGHIEAHSA